MRRATLLAVTLSLFSALVRPVIVQTGPLFDVRQNGAAGNGVALDTFSINKTIESCAAAGGGTVYFPAGTYLSGTILLKSNVTLWLASGATVVGSRNLADYRSAVDGDHWFDALVLAKGVQNVAIIGRGLIDGNKIRDPNGEEKIRGPHAILFYDSQNITVRDISIKDSGNYSLILRSCKGVNVEGINVHGGWDGINMWDTLDATISNCRIYAGDDGLAGRYWQNVTVTNCVLNASANAIRVGGRNVLIADSIIYGPGESRHGTSLRHRTEAGFQILPNGSGAANKFATPGPIDNMVLSNITMINVGTPFYVAYSSDAPYSVNNLGVGRIIVNNLVALDAGKIPIYISAPPNNPAKSIILNNVRVTVAGGANETQSEGQGFSPFSILQSYGVYARNVQNLELHDVKFDSTLPDLRPALFGEHVGTVELDRFHPAITAADGAPPIQLAGVHRLVIDGVEPSSASVQITSVNIPQSSVIANDPFAVTVAVANTGPAGLANITMQVGKETVERSVVLRANEKGNIMFANLRVSAAGPLEIRSGELSRRMDVLPSLNGHAVENPFKVFHNTTADLRQLGDNSFFIRAEGDYPVMQYDDQYGAIYQPGGLPREGTVIVKLENPELRTNWQGRVGIIVRNDVSKPGDSGGYLVLDSSPAAGSYLEWSTDNGKSLNEHSEFVGYTVWPHWLKLERHGNQFIGYSSEDGNNWTEIGKVDLPGTHDVLDVGMFAFRSSARFLEWKIQGR